MASKPAAKVASTTAVAVKPENAVVDASTAALFQQNAGAGFQNTNKDSFAIPFLVILQSLSPQVKKSDPAYVKGAEEGDFYDSVRNVVVAKGEDGVDMIPCAYANTFVEWQVREKGGGFKGEHTYADGVLLRGKTRKDEKNRDILPNSNQLNDTRNHAVLVMDENGDWQPYMISLTSTQIGASKRWMTAMNNLKMTSSDGFKFTPPMFGTMWHASAQPQSNEKGSWSGWLIEPKGYVSDADAFAQAKTFHDQYASGAVKVAERTDDAEGSAEPKEGEQF